MKSLLCTLLCLFSLATVGQNLGLSGAQVVDVEKGKIISGQTVLIAEGKISQIGPDEKVIIPEGVTNLSLEGQYVIPGLIDAHIHIFQSGGLYTRPDAIDLRKFRPYKEERRLNRERAGDRLRRYLRAGITSVMDVGGPLSQFGLRDSLNQHADLAHWWLTGPLVSTYQPVAFQIDDSPILKANSPEEAREMVRAQLPYRPDFIKIWYIQFPGQDPKKSLPIVQATIEESHQHKLRVAVHATQLETASLAVGAGCDVLVHSVDNTLLPKAFVKELKKKEVVYVPTLIVSDKYREVFGQQNELSYEDFTLADPFVIGELFDLKHLPVPRLIDRYQDIAARQFERNQRSDSIRKANLKLLADAGALIATGTDAGNIGTQHVSSYYTELAAMAEAGLSMEQLLRYSTFHGARALGKGKSMGRLEAGYQADVVVLEKNPLESLEHWKSPSWVVKKGVLIDPDTLIHDSPEMLAQRQLNGYNARNLEAFLEPYSDSVELYNFPNERFAKGKEAMRQIYGEMFQRTPDLHCELVHRMVLGKTVIDQERVTGFGERVVEAIAIYEVEEAKIARVYFVRK